MAHQCRYGRKQPKVMTAEEGTLPTAAELDNEGGGGRGDFSFDSMTSMSNLRRHVMRMRIRGHGQSFLAHGGGKEAESKAIEGLLRDKK